MSGSLTRRLDSAEAELREQQRAAAVTHSPFDILEDYDEEEFDRLIIGQRHRPTIPPPPPGADLEFWARRASLLSACIDVLQGLPIPNGLAPDIHEAVLKFQRKRAAESLSKGESETDSRSTSTTTQGSCPSVDNQDVFPIVDLDDPDS